MYLGVRILIGALFLAVVILAMLFSLNNAQLAEVNFYIGVVKLPISLWISLSLLSGFLLGLLASSGVVVRLYMQRRKHRKVAENAEKIATLQR